MLSHIIKHYSHYTLTDPKSRFLAIVQSELAMEVQGNQHIALHDHNALGIYGLDVDIFKERNKVGFGSVLEGSNSSCLKADIQL